MKNKTTFDNWILPHKNNLDSVVRRLLRKFSMYKVITYDYAENICLFVMWEIFLSLPDSNIKNEDIPRMMFSYCNNAIRTLMQKEKIILDSGKPHHSHGYCDIDYQDNLPIENNTIKHASDNELAYIAINAADENELKYIQSVFYDGLTMVDTAKKHNVHTKTVAYHLRKFIKKVRKILNIQTDEINLNFNVEHYLSPARNQCIPNC